MKKLYPLFLLAIGLWSMISVSIAQQPFLKSSTVVVGDLLDAGSGSDFTAVLYSRSGSIYFNQMDLSGEWMGEVLLGVGTEGSVAVDNLDVIHVAFVEKDTLYHKTYNETVWSDRDTIASNNGGKCSKPDLALDGNGKVHLTYTDTMGNTHWYTNKPDIMYANNTSGDFVKNLIFDGYYENWGGSAYWGEYFDKGSKIAVSSDGDYYLLAHKQVFDRSSGGTAYRTYSLQIKSNLGTGTSTTSSTDIFDLYELVYNVNQVVVLYKESSFRTSILSVASEILSFTNTQSITATSVSTFTSDGTNRVIGGKSNTNLLTLYNDFSHAYTDVVVKGTKVPVVELNGTFYAFYTDNAEGTIQMREVAQPLSLMSFSLAEQTAPAAISIKDATISIKVPEGTDLTGLVPSYTTTVDVEGVQIGAVDQTSGTSAVDFSSPVTYVLNSAGGSRNWTVTVSYDVPNSINTSAPSKIRLFPNPFSEMVYFSNAGEIKRVEVKNLLGQTLFESNSGNIETINTSMLDKGVYLFVIELMNGEKVVQKMQKK